jgi:hypothetical protein
MRRSVCVSLPASSLWGVDARDMGNETRMINHFRGIAEAPNCKMITAYVNELPKIMIVVSAGGKTIVIASSRMSGAQMSDHWERYGLS